MYMKMKNYFWGCAVLGMHDAIVSTIGLVVGLVSADATQYVILLTGVIAAVAAGLSTRADGRLDVARYCGAATGVVYIFTAAMVLMPFVFIANSVLAMLLSYFVAIAIIFFFNYMKSKLSGERFWPHFTEMLIICVVVTLAAFLIGECAKVLWGIEI